jgi:hypothetical protein
VFQGFSFGVDRDDKKVPRSPKADATKIIVAASGDFKLSIISKGSSLRLQQRVIRDRGRFLAPEFFDFISF